MLGPAPAELVQGCQLWKKPSSAVVPGGSSQNICQPSSDHCASLAAFCLRQHVPPASTSSGRVLASSRAASLPHWCSQAAAVLLRASLRARAKWVEHESGAGGAGHACVGAVLHPGRGSGVPAWLGSPTPRPWPPAPARLLTQQLACSVLSGRQEPTSLPCQLGTTAGPSVPNTVADCVRRRAAHEGQGRAQRHSLQRPRPPPPSATPAGQCRAGQPRGSPAGVQGRRRSGWPRPSQRGA